MPLLNKQTQNILMIGGIAVIGYLIWSSRKKNKSADCEKLYEEFKIAREKDNADFKPEYMEKYYHLVNTCPDIFKQIKEQEAISYQKQQADTQKMDKRGIYPVEDEKIQDIPTF